MLKVSETLTAASRRQRQSSGHDGVSGEQRMRGEDKWRGEDLSIGVCDELHAATQELDGSVLCFKSDVAARTEARGPSDSSQRLVRDTHMMKGRRAGVWSKYCLKTKGQEAILFHLVKYNSQMSKQRDKWTRERGTMMSDEG